jgi:NAD(P)H-dependent FMN reductase
MIVIGSVRPGRVGLPVAEWVQRVATEHGGFEIDLVDLAEVNLPFLDEPKHPLSGEYTKQHTIDWSRRVDAADAFIFVSPEYNHSYSPALKNSIDFLYNEWSRKPVGLVSYGGVSGGTRGVVGLEPVLNEVGLVSAKTGVEIPFVRTHVTDGVFVPDEKILSSIEKLFTELAKLSESLKASR